MRSIKIGLLAAVALTAAVYAGDGLRKWREPNGRIYFGDAPPAGSVGIGDSEGVFGDPADEEQIEAELLARQASHTREQYCEDHFRELEATYPKGAEHVITRECWNDATERGSTDWIAADSCSRRRIAALQAR